ncbi:hypothetical protein SDC9_161004 [bioreactor metagenome]|uniref:Uncharacterized protein n=1 Tax=bioreactor metagenome TaxID=1076179 RepID=A0A645FH28_9ZZZZ
MVERELLACLRGIHLLAQLHERADFCLDRQIEMRNLLLGLREALGDGALQTCWLAQRSCSRCSLSDHRSLR